MKIKAYIEKRRPGDPKAPLAGEPASPVKPATRPQKPPSEEAGKQTTKAKKKPLKKEAGKQIPGDALEEPPPAPPGPGTRRAGAYGKPTGETVTLRIRIVKSNAPAAELRKPEAAPRKAKPTKSKGK